MWLLDELTLNFEAEDDKGYSSKMLLLQAYVESQSALKLK